MPEKNYSFELHEFQEALSPYGTLDTTAPSLSTFTLNDFREGDHFRTGTDANFSIQ